MPASASNAAIAAVEPASAMIAGWQDAPTNAIAAACIGRRGFQRRPIAEPTIVPDAEARRDHRP